MEVQVGLRSCSTWRGCELRSTRDQTRGWGWGCSGGVTSRWVWGMNQWYESSVHGIGGKLRRESWSVHGIRTVHQCGQNGRQGNSKLPTDGAFVFGEPSRILQPQGYGFPLSMGKLSVLGVNAGGEKPLQASVC